MAPKEKAEELIGKFTNLDIEYFEIYIYENENEKRVFEWRK